MNRSNAAYPNCNTWVGCDIQAAIHYFETLRELIRNDVASPQDTAEHPHTCLQFGERLGEL